MEVKETKTKELRILSIDPGNIETAFVLMDKDLKPIRKEKIENGTIMEYIYNNEFQGITDIAIEMVACYGMAVGKTVFDTCVWIGRFTECLNKMYNVEPKYIYRKDEKMNLCHTMKANDSNITQALIDRFAPDTPNKGKGSKKEQGYFYGFAKDIWQAYAVGITYYDMYIKNK